MSVLLVLQHSLSEDGGVEAGEAGVIPGFKFHSAVVAGGGTGKRW